MKLSVCFALLLGLAAAAQSQAEDYYFYKGPKEELIMAREMGASIDMNLKV